MPQDYFAYVEAREQEIIRDIKRLVDIKSVKDKPAAGAPYGEGVRRAQLAAMELCREAGLEVTDLDGRVAYGHYGDTGRFIAIAAHVDVVPEGAGWDSEPYALTLRDGYMVGRGVGDDKGPFVLALYAIKYLIENGIKLNYGIRLIIGLDEELGMGDIEYYNERCTAALFAFTPDAEFPVGHGEKGIFGADLVSQPAAARITALAGGVAENVVPDRAEARLAPGTEGPLLAAAAGRGDIETAVLPGGGVRVAAKGLARHAGMPEGGVNANMVLLRFLLDSGVLEGGERDTAEFLCGILGSIYGERFGIDGGDGLFTPLTIIGGTLSLTADGRFRLNVNCRYTTAITEGELRERIVSVCAQNGFEMDNAGGSAPFYLPPETPAVKLLCDIYNELTGGDEKPLVMSGGTYARKMHNAVSYGIEFPGAADPGWVGAAHMKNEAVSVARAKKACEIFINTLVRLQDVEL